MRYTPFPTLFGFLVLAVSSALAQTTTAPNPASGAEAGGVNWWWLIIVLLVIAAGAWYFMRGRGRV